MTVSVPAEHAEYYMAMHRFTNNSALKAFLLIQAVKGKLDGLSTVLHKHGSR